MKLDQQQQAQHLYFQTDLTQQEIADTLGIDRRTLYNWIRQYNWDRIRQNAECMPTQLAENCYRIFHDLTTHLLSEERIGKPATAAEVNSMYKLTLTINKLNKKPTLNENLETFAHFMDHVAAQDPQAALLMKPFVDSFITGKAVAPQHYRQPATAASSPGPSAEELQQLMQSLEALAAREQQLAQQSADSISAVTAPVSPTPVPAQPTSAPVATTPMSCATSPSLSERAGERSPRISKFKQKSPFRKELEAAFAKNRMKKAA